MKIEILVPDSFMPKITDPDNVCECQKRPFKIAHRHGKIHWLREDGEHVEEGEIVAEGEIEKKIIEMPAPCTGILEITLAEAERFGRGDVVGYVLQDAN